uniref:Uncharacterized protein n=1 Tax=Panagrolaimus sp. ES5 TaxID=591445 RepID=A0AC34FMB0_9BILA
MSKRIGTNDPSRSSSTCDSLSTPRRKDLRSSSASQFRAQRRAAPSFDVSSIPPNDSILGGNFHASTPLTRRNSCRYFYDAGRNQPIGFEGAERMRGNFMENLQKCTLESFIESYSAGSTQSFQEQNSELCDGAVDELSATQDDTLVESPEIHEDEGTLVESSQFDVHEVLDNVFGENEDQKVPGFILDGDEAGSKTTQNFNNSALRQVSAGRGALCPALIISNARRDADQQESDGDIRIIHKNPIVTFPEDSDEDEDVAKQVVPRHQHGLRQLLMDGKLLNFSGADTYLENRGNRREGYAMSNIADNNLLGANIQLPPSEQFRGQRRQILGVSASAGEATRRLKNIQIHGTHPGSDGSTFPRPANQRYGEAQRRPIATPNFEFHRETRGRRVYQEDSFTTRYFDEDGYGSGIYQHSRREESFRYEQSFSSATRSFRHEADSRDFGRMSTPLTRRNSLRDHRENGLRQNQGNQRAQSVDDILSKALLDNEKIKLSKKLNKDTEKMRREYDY